MNQTLRIGDAEREEAARELGEHYALGRISSDEHSERLERIWAARTSAELAPVFSDLPRPQPERPAPTTRDRIRSFAPTVTAVPFPLRLLCFVVLFVLAVTHLPVVLVALLVYLLVVRRVAWRRRSPWHGHWR